MRRLLTLVSMLVIAAGMLVGPALADDLMACRDRATPPDEAIATCTRLIAASKLAGPDLAAALVGRGNALFAKREFDRARADFDLAISRAAGFGPAYWGRARTRFAKSDFDGAIADYDQAIRLNPRVPVFYIDRASTWRRKGDLDHAIADYGEALRIDPGFAGAYIGRGLAYEAKGDRDRARADYEAVLRLTPRGEPGRRIQDTARARLVSLGPADHGAPASSAAARPPAPRIGPVALAAPAAPTAGAPAAAPSAPPTAPPAMAPPARATPVAAPGPAPVVAAPPAKPAVPPQIPAATPVVATAAAPPPATAAIAPATAPADIGYRLALVIGNGGYVNASALPNPPNDAKAVAKVLREMGFEVIEGTDLDRSGMERIIRDFLHKAPHARVTLLFYAGHGMQVDGKNYLVPIDAKLTAPSDLGFETIELDKILAGLDDEARANIIILDACRDNPLARSFASRMGASRSAAVPSGLAGYATVGTGTLIAFATAPGQTALDGRDANSPFTTALIKYLRTPGIEVNQMLTRVRVEVASITGNKQIPWANSSLLGDVYLAGGKP